jgi:DNA polymerase III subunit epsilon
MEITVASSTDQTPRYQQLLERADAFIIEKGGAVHEDLLIRQVFGSSSRADMWRPLLRQVLHESDRLSLRADGYWMVKPATPDDLADSPLLEGPFVVIDVETTGLKSAHHRVIEFGAVRYEDGVQTGTLSVLVQPERRVPQYVRKLTGIDDSLLADAPLFADAADEILEFIEDVPLIGYNVGFDVSFLNAELKRCGRDTLLNHAIDLLPVASAMIPGC